MKKIIKLSFVFVTLLTLSGCSVTPNHAPKAANENVLIKKFSQNINPASLKLSLIDEIDKSGWEVVSTETTNGELVLKAQKNYKYKSKYFNHSAYRGTRSIKEENVSIAISLNASELKIVLESNPAEKIEKLVQSDVADIHNKVISVIAISKV